MSWQEKEKTFKRRTRYYIRYCCAAYLLLVCIVSIVVFVIIMFVCVRGARRLERPTQWRLRWRAFAKLFVVVGMVVLPSIIVVYC